MIDSHLLPNINNYCILNIKPEVIENGIIINFEVLFPTGKREAGMAQLLSTRLPPMWPGFDSRTRRLMWVEFVVGSRPCSEGFSPGSLVFFPPQKPTFLNSNSIWNARSPLNELLESSLLLRG